MDPVIECTTFSMTQIPVAAGASQKTNCAQQTGGTVESRVCGLEVSTCSMDAAKNITCSDAKIGCCTPK
jgi:hypothetical protein